MSEFATFLWSFLLHDMIVITLVPVVLLRRKEPAATIAWLLAVLLMPFVGALAFLMFGNTRLERRAVEHRKRKGRVRSKIPSVSGNLATPIDARGQLQLYRLLDNINPMPPVAGNEIDIYDDMHRNFADQLQAIDEARHHVHVEYYIVQPDRSGHRFRDALIAAARRGVQVRFLYDAVGSMGLSKEFLAAMRAVGIAASACNPFRIWTHRFVFNFRNHRKILVADGKVGFTGGSNIGDEYLGESEIGVWRDTHLRLVGPVVQQLQRVFLEDWAFVTGEELTGEELFPRSRRFGDVIAQVVPGGPDTEIKTYHELYFSAIANAVERIRIMTPYFVPSEALLVGLQTAARRGVDVRIATPGKSTHDFVHLAGRSYYQDLLDAGVGIYEFQGGFLHSKTLTIDGRWSVVGTANLDNRSMKLNFEIGVVLYDAALTRAIDEIFDRNAIDSRRIDQKKWNDRRLVQRIAENSARLFSPIL